MDLSVSRTREVNGSSEVESSFEIIESSEAKDIYLSYSRI